MRLYLWSLTLVKFILLHGWKYFWQGNLLWENCLSWRLAYFYRSTWWPRFIIEKARLRSSLVNDWWSWPIGYQLRGRNILLWLLNSIIAWILKIFFNTSLYLSVRKLSWLCKFSLRRFLINSWIHITCEIPACQSTTALAVTNICYWLRKKILMHIFACWTFNWRNRPRAWP